MTDGYKLEDRLTDLGRAVPPDPGLARRVHSRVSQPEPLTTLDLFRLWLSGYSSVVTVWVVGLTAVAVAHIFGTPPPAAAPPRVWFYDTVTGVVYPDKAGKVPPTLSPGGNPAVRVHLFSCGTCEESRRFTGYYERYTEALKRQLEGDPQAAAFHEFWLEGREYSLDARSWFPADSPEGRKIADDLLQRCPEKKVRYCPP